MRCSCDDSKSVLAQTQDWLYSVELDIENFEALRNYLSLRGHLHPGEAVSFDVLPGGVSNRTVRATWADGRSWVLKQALPKLRVNDRLV